MTGLTLAGIGLRMISETKRDELYDGQDLGRFVSMATLPHGLSEPLSAVIRGGASMFEL